MRALLASMALLVAAAPAVAGEHAPAPFTVEHEALPYMDHFAKCVVDGDRHAAIRTLAVEEGTPAFTAALRALARDNRMCVPRGSKLAFGGIVLAGIMATRVIDRTYGLASLPRLVAYHEGTAPIQPHDMGAYASLCTVRKAPEDVAALLATPLDSEQEHQALQPLVQVFADCLPQGRTAQMNAMGLRASLALASYHLIQQNSPATAPAGRS